MTDRNQIMSAATANGWSSERSGRTLIFRKNGRSVTASFNEGTETDLVVWLAGAYRGKGGLKGILRLLKHKGL